MLNKMKCAFEAYLKTTNNYYKIIKCRYYDEIETSIRKFQFHLM